MTNLPDVTQAVGPVTPEPTLLTAMPRTTVLSQALHPGGTPSTQPESSQTPLLTPQTTNLKSADKAMAFRDNSVADRTMLT